MSPTRKLICAAAAGLALVIPAGCASPSHHNAHPQTRRSLDPGVVASMERQMLHEVNEGGVQLGASDRLGRSLHGYHAMVTLARHMEETDTLFAGVETSQPE